MCLHPIEERYKITPEQAFLVLTRLSHDTDTKLREVAAELVRSGSLPDQDADTGR